VQLRPVDQAVQTFAALQWNDPILAAMDDQDLVPEGGDRLLVLRQ
jgi:hypothetical protein